MQWLLRRLFNARGERVFMLVALFVFRWRRLLNYWSDVLAGRPDESAKVSCAL